MASVTFSPSVGGDGSTVTDDNNASTGLGNGGHRTRFVPSLSQVVAVAANTVTKATEASASATTAANYATKTDGFASGSDNSAKSWAVGGTGAGAPVAGSAKDWATKTSGTVDGVEYSAKKYAQDAAVLFDQFDDKYLGAKASDPTLDNDGNPLQAGAIYINTTTNLVRFYTGSSWQNGISAVAGVSSVDGQTGDLVTKTINGNAILGSGDITVGTIGSFKCSVDLGAIYPNQSITFTITDYDSFSTYSVSATVGSVSISGEVINYTASSASGPVTLTVTVNGTQRLLAFTVQPAGIATPVNQTPSNGATNQSSSVTLTASSFQWLGVADTQLNSDWQVAADAGFTTIIASSMADAVNKTSWTVTGLSTSQTYYWRVRYRGNTNGVSSYSAAFSFSTAAVFGGLIGTQGGQGFGVGIYPTTLPSGFSNMAGNTDPANDNYGNYQTTNGSVMVFVPRFYYRIGHASSPRFATYGANAVDVVGVDTFATEAAANAAGYAMHRAFKDGEADKSGFFIDKYLASKDGTSSCKSIFGGVPISLTAASASWTTSGGMTGCTGILADAVVLSRARGVGVFNCASVFMYSALALLSLAHAQSSTSTVNNAWYHATNNFPKGCNNSALGDTNDATVAYTTAGDSGGANKPKTGATSNFAKTTHNGQNCGVADLNGCMYQVALGVTDFGTSATDTSQHTNGNAYVLKASVALSSLTAGWDGTNDAWGNTTSLATKYDAVSGLLPWDATTGWTYFGNGSNEVFSGNSSGVSWQRTACGIQNTTSGTSGTGTSLFGNDGCYQYNTANLFVLCSGYWNGAADAGVFCRGWYGSRAYVSANFGFRSCAYGS